MKMYHVELNIGGHVQFEYEHRASEALEEAGQSLANQMDGL